jgi:hypothetical protein
MLRRLESDAARLKALPPVKLSPDYSQNMLREITTRRIPAPGKRTNPRKNMLRTRWAPAAVAAAVVLAIGLGTFAILHNLTKDPGNGSVAKNVAPNTQGNGGNGFKANDESRIARLEASKQAANMLRDDLAKASDNVAQAGRVIIGIGEDVARTIDGGRIEIARLAGRTPPTNGNAELDVPFSPSSILTMPFSPTKSFKTIDMKLSLVGDLKSLDSKKLQAQLQPDSLHFIDCACGESNKAYERLQAICKTAGVKLVIEPQVQKAISKKIPGAFMVYFENVKPDQLNRLVAALQNEEKKKEQFPSVLIQTLDEDGKKRFAEMIGLPVHTMSPVRSSGRPDPTKPLSNDTLKSLEKVAAGQGAKGTGKEPTAYAFTYTVMRGRLIYGSKDVRQILDARQGWQPDAVHVVMLLRPSR